LTQEHADATTGFSRNILREEQYPSCDDELLKISKQACGTVISERMIHWLAKREGCKEVVYY
jgi:hypothetical protein